MLNSALMWISLLLAVTAQELPLSLSEAFQEGRPAPRHPDWHRPYEYQAGLRFGYLEPKDADDGTWFVGFQLRHFFSPMIAGELSVEFHQSDFEDDGVKVNEWPIQLSAVLFPFPRMRMRPYVLAGVGWYVSQINVRSGSTIIVTDETETTFGAHAGAGAEVHVTAQYSISGDVRYVALEEAPFDDTGVAGQDLDYWQATLSLNFKF